MAGHTQIEAGSQARIVDVVTLNVEGSERIKTMKTSLQGTKFRDARMARLNRISRPLLIMLAWTIVGFAQLASRPVPARQRLGSTYDHLPLVFEPNLGQTDPQVKFVARRDGYSVLLTRTGLVLSTAGHAPVRLKLLGANPAPRIKGHDKLSSTSNYFFGKDSASWRGGVPNYAGVLYEKIYPGVDLLFYGNQRLIEHDFVVAPGASPGRIHFAVNGASRVALNAEGELEMRVGEAEIRLRKPGVYQETGEIREEIPGRYRLLARNEVGFEIGAYDSSRPLVIDPVLVYSTYLGSSGTESSVSLTVDAKGSAYVVGQTNSADFPTSNAVQARPAGGLEGFVSKLSPDGSSLVFSTYLGGSGDDFARGVKVDKQGNVYVVGRTTSTDFPTTSDAWQKTFGGGVANAFLVKLSPDGSKLLYSTYLGGTGSDLANDVQIDDQGNIFVIGNASSRNFPTMAALQPQFGGGSFDAFVTKFNASGSVVFSTFLGGAGEDRGFLGSLDANGNVYLVGRTASIDFPTANAFQKTYGGGPYDAYVAKLSTDGHLLYASYLGGKGEDQPVEIALDGAANMYITGLTNSSDFPTKNALQPALKVGTCSSPPRACYDAFVTKLSADGSSLVYSTYLGGSEDDNRGGLGEMAVDASGSAYIAGATTSPDFPIVDALQPGLHPGVCGTPPIACEDGFVAKLSPDGSSLIYSTYLGGSGTDEIWDLKLDGAGNAYVFGQTTSTDFPLSNPLQKEYGGGASDVFVAKLGRASRTIAVSLATMTSPLAPESFGTLLGSGLAQSSVIADLQSPPTTLGGISVLVHDSMGVARPAPLLSVSSTQINFEVPAGTASGDATLEIVNAPTTLPPVGVPIRTIAPGLFTLKNNSAAAYGVRIEPDGSQTILPAGSPIILDSRPVYLSLFGTGIRNRSALNNVACTIGGLSVPVVYAGPGGGVPGLDQANVFLTPALKGNSDGHLILTVDGVAANVVKVDVR
jgi:uncharacterized protein (TIGR03437 family)